MEELALDSSDISMLSLDVFPAKLFNNIFLPFLEALVASECSKLVNLAPSSSSFSSLTTLDVWKCHGPEHIFASSTAKSLVQLTKMRIRNCNKVAEIVTIEEKGETF